MTKIIKCGCTHSQQDKLYGEGRRVANSTKNDSKKGGKEYRCTVCGKAQ